MHVHVCPTCYKKWNCGVYDKSKNRRCGGEDRSVQETACNECRQAWEISAALGESQKINAKEMVESIEDFNANDTLSWLDRALKAVGSKKEYRDEIIVFIDRKEEKKNMSKASKLLDDWNGSVLETKNIRVSFSKDHNDVVIQKKLRSSGAMASEYVTIDFGDVPALAAWLKEWILDEAGDGVKPSADKT